MKISVIIATRDRRDDLRDCISGFERQSYADKEIIVVDNASTDGTETMMRTEFPHISYTRLPDNIDILAQNIGIAMSSGEIIWRTDDDAYPEDPGQFARAVDIFRRFDHVDIISCVEVQVNKNYNVVNIYPHPYDKVPEDGLVFNTFMGAGAAIRRRVFDKIGYYWGFGMEELEFCTRAIIAGFGVRLFPSFRVLHFSSPRTRNSQERWVRISSMHIRYSVKFYHGFSGFVRMIFIFLTSLLDAARHRIRPLALLEGIYSMMAAAIKAYRSERVFFPREKLKEISLGTNIYKFQAMYFMNVFRGIAKRLRGK